MGGCTLDFNPLGSMKRHFFEVHRDAGHTSADVQEDLSLRWVGGFPVTGAFFRPQVVMLGHIVHRREGLRKSGISCIRGDCMIWAFIA